MYKRAEELVVALRGVEEPYDANTVEGLLESNKEMLFILKQIIDMLPSHRDWLDPDIERAAKEIIKLSKS